MRRALDIAFFGSSLVSSYWNGAATYYRGVVRGLAARGHRVTFYEPDAFERQRHRDMPDPSWAKVVVYANDPGEALRMVDAARAADVVVKASGVGVHDALLEQAVLASRRAGSTVVFWDVDAAATLDRVEEDAADPFRALVPRYDMIFTYGGGPPVVGRYRTLGARACAPVYNALDPDTHFRVAREPRFACALALLANRLPDRERRVDDFFFAAARALPDRGFLLGGSGWDDKEAPPNVRRIGHVPTADHNALNSSALLVLNVARDGMAANGFSPATRIFEAAGAGACIVTDAWNGIEAFLEPGREVLVARDGDDVARFVKRVDRAQARIIGGAARRRVVAEHTYTLRARQVEALLIGADTPSRELNA